LHQRPEAMSAAAVDHSRIATPMRLDAIAIGIKPPDDVNVVIEVPIGGEPIKYGWTKRLAR
jgi:hypothetical protein